MLRPVNVKHTNALPWHGGVAADPSGYESCFTFPIGR